MNISVPTTIQIKNFISVSYYIIMLFDIDPDIKEILGTIIDILSVEFVGYSNN